MIGGSKKNQTTGDYSVNIQAETLSLQVTNSDNTQLMKSLLDLFSDNIIKMRKDAQEIAEQRAKEFCQRFEKELFEKYPDFFQSDNDSSNILQDPAMNDTLFMAMKGYAKSGDKEVQDILVDLLVDRTTAPIRSSKQIAIDEAVYTTPLLTPAQIDTLTILFVLTKVSFLFSGRIFLEDFTRVVNRSVTPFIDKLLDSNNGLKSLEYRRVALVRVGNYQHPAKKWREDYPAFFSNGFTLEQFRGAIGNSEYSFNLQQCFHNSEKGQLPVLDKETLEDYLDKFPNLDKNIRGNVHSLFESTTMRIDEVKRYLLSTFPEFEKLFRVWENTILKNMELTDIGVAIGHANIRRITGDNPDLSIWINW